MAHIGVAHDDERAVPSPIRHRVAREIEEGQHGVVIDGIGPQSSTTGLRAHERGYLVETHAGRLAPLDSLRQSAV